MTALSLAPPPMPVLFVSHGAPTFALEPSRAGAQLHALGKRLRLRSDLRAMAVISAHWQTRGGVALTHSATPATVHDFGGFPAPLYALRYPAPGAPALAAHTAELLDAAGFATALDEARGLDHGTWVPLMHLMPEATVPVFQISLPHPLDAASALRLGQALKPLREAGVLLVGSGSLTHNLYEMAFDAEASPAAPHVQAFIDWARAAVQAHDLDALAHWQTQAPGAHRVHPTPEHFWPLVVVMAATQATDPVELLDGGILYRALAMESYLLGTLSEPVH